MVSSIQAKYYDGNTSIAHSVTVVLSPAFLEINFIDSNHPKVLWKASAITADAQLNQSTIQLFYGEFPSQILELENSAEVVAVLQNHTNLKSVTKKSFYVSLIKNKRNIFFLFLSLIGISLAIYFLILPRLSPIIVNQISMTHEIQLGSTVYKSMLADETIDSKKTILVNEYWKEMNYSSPYPVKITVIENDDINAFALPGGNIVIFDSILKTMKHHEQLAALLSHEFIHIKNRHSLNSLVSAYAGVLFIELLFGNSSSTFNSIFQNAHTFSTLKYSRKLEEEADLEGMSLMYNNRIAPIGMYQLFQTLYKSEKEYGIDKIPEFLTNHPIIKNRLSYSKLYAEKHSVQEKNEVLEKIFIEIKSE